MRGTKDSQFDEHRYPVGAAGSKHCCIDCAFEGLDPPHWYGYKVNTNMEYLTRYKYLVIDVECYPRGDFPDILWWVFSCNLVPGTLRK